MEQVRVCHVCGHINPGEEIRRCYHCWARLGAVDPVHRPEGEQRVHLFRIRALRTRILRTALLVAAAAGFTVWGVLVFFEIGPNPPSPTTQISASVAPQTWAQGRRTPESTSFTPDLAPVPARIAWTYSTPKRLNSSPAVVGDRVFLTTEDGRTVALDRTSGRVVWEYVSGNPSDTTPAVAGDVVIFAVRQGNVIGLDRATGSLLWETDLDAPVLASPIAVDGSVYIGASDKRIYALDAATGKKRWSFETNDWIDATVSYADNTVVVASQDPVIHIIDTVTGRKRFVYDTGLARNPRGGTAIAGDMAFFNSDRGFVWGIKRGEITYPFGRAFNTWKLNFYVWRFIGDAPIQKGSVWATRVGGQLLGTPALAHGAAYVANVEGEVSALEQSTGEPRWTTSLGVQITTDASVAGTTLLVGADDGRVFGLDTQTGQVLWDFRAGGPVVGNPVVAGDTIYVASRDGTLYAIAGAE